MSHKHEGAGHAGAGEVAANRGRAGSRDRRSIHLMMSNQREVLRDTMLKATGYGLWLTLREVARLTLFGEASISAQLRHLRKRKHGGFRVEKRRRISAEIRRTGRLAPVWEYQLRGGRRSRIASATSDPRRPVLRAAASAANQIDC